jgi:hypothetical protein
MTINENDRGGTGDQPVDRAATGGRHPEQQHPVQEAHGGSMAPGLVDDSGHPVAPAPPDDAGEWAPPDAAGE